MLRDRRPRHPIEEQCDSKTLTPLLVAFRKRDPEQSEMIKAGDVGIGKREELEIQGFLLYSPSICNPNSQHQL